MLSTGVTLPNTPKRPEETVGWAAALNKALKHTISNIVMVLNKAVVYDENGNVAIGTSALFMALTVFGITRTAGALQINNSSFGADFWHFSHRGSGSSNRYGVYYNNGGYSAELFTQLTDGKVGILKTGPNSNLAVTGLPTYADNAAAKTGGLTAGDFYRTSTGVLMVVYD